MGQGGSTGGGRAGGPHSQLHSDATLPTTDADFARGGGRKFERPWLRALVQAPQGAGLGVPLRRRKLFEGKPSRDVDRRLRTPSCPSTLVTATVAFKSAAAKIMTVRDCNLALDD